MICLGTVLENAKGKDIQTPTTTISEIDVQYIDL